MNADIDPIKEIKSPESPHVVRMHEEILRKRQRTSSDVQQDRLKQIQKSHFFKRESRKKITFAAKKDSLLNVSEMNSGNQDSKLTSSFALDKQEERIILLSMISNTIQAPLHLVYEGVEFTQNFVKTLVTQNGMRIQALLNVTVDKGYVNYRIQIKSLTLDNQVVEIDYNGLAEFNNSKLTKIIEEVHFPAFVPGNRTPLGLRRYEALLDIIFLRGLELKEIARNNFKLQFNPKGAAILELDWEMERSTFKIRMVHSYHRCFRIIVFDIGDILFYIDFWFDKKFFDENFEIVDFNYIGEYYQNILIGENKHLTIEDEFLRDKLNSAIIRNAECMYRVRGMIINMLTSLRIVLKSTNNTVSRLIGERIYITSNQLGEKVYQFALARQHTQHITFSLFRDSTKQTSKFRYDFEDLERLFCIEFENLLSTEKDYFVGILSLGILSSFKESNTETETEIFMRASYYRRIFPGVNYKSPLTVSLIVTGDTHPIGVRVDLVALPRLTCIQQFTGGHKEYF